MPTSKKISYINKDFDETPDKDFVGLGDAEVEEKEIEARSKFTDIQNEKGEDSPEAKAAKADWAKHMTEKNKRKGDMENAAMWDSIRQDNDASYNPKKKDGPSGGPGAEPPKQEPGRPDTTPPEEAPSEPAEREPANDDPESKVPSIGSYYDRTLGGVYKGRGQLDSNDLILDDSSYRNIIYAKIIQNSTNCRIEHVLTFIDYVVGMQCDTEITEPSPNNALITIHENLGQLQRVGIGLTMNMVRPTGVKFVVQDNRGIIDTTPYTNESLLKVGRLYGHKI